MAQDCQNCYNCGKPGHLTKDCLNCYRYKKPRHFARDFPEQDKSTTEQGNVRVSGLTQGEVDACTSQVVAGQISIAHISVYALIDSGTLYSFVSALFVKKLDMEPMMLEEVCVVSLPSGENLISRFSFKEVLVKVAGRRLIVDWIVLEMVDLI